MGILDELRQEANKKARASQPRPGREAPPLSVHLATVRPLIETMFSYLEHFAEECNAIEPDIAASYRVTDAQSLIGLQQRHYSVEWTDVRRCCFTLAYFCVGHAPLTISVSTRPGRQTMLEHLKNHGLQFRIDDLSEWQYAFTVEPRVPVRIRFEPDADVAAVRMTTRNLDALGQSRFVIDAGLIDDTLLDELARRLVRKPSRFDELIGNRVPETVREQFREKIAARRRSREALDKSRSRRGKAKA